MRKSIILLVLVLFLVPSVYAHHTWFHFGSGNAVGEKCQTHTDCSTFLCFNVDPNGLDMQCVACGKKIPVKGGGSMPGWETGWQGKPIPPTVEPACGNEYSVCNKNKNPYTCEKPKDPCGGCAILSKCNEQTKKCESLFTSTNDCPTASMTLNPTAAEINQKVAFTANEKDKNNDKITCTWKDGSTKIGTQCKFDYSFSLTGDHKITLEVTDGKQNCQKAYTASIKVTASETPTPALLCKTKEHIIFTMSDNKNANVGTWDSGLGVQVCHNGVTGLKRDCTGNNKVLKYLTGKGYAPNYEAPGLKDICYGDYSCYLTPKNSACKEGFSCLASFKDVKNSQVGVCDKHPYKLCCKQGCPMIEMKCAQTIMDQEGELSTYKVCDSDSKKAPGTCQPGCAFNGLFYKDDSEAIVKIQGKDLVCTNGYWCPIGFEYIPTDKACEPATEKCFVPNLCSIDTPTVDKKDTKWFTNNKCIKIQQKQACCFIKFGTTKYYGYDILPDQDEISFY